MITTSRVNRRDLRQLIQKLLQTDGDQDVFVRDCFHEVFQLFMTGMERNQKLNLLFEHYEPDEILQALQKRYPKEVSKFLADLDSPEPEPGPT